MPVVVVLASHSREHIEHHPVDGLEHPNVGIIRSDYCVALVLSGEKATAISADRIRFKLTAYYRHVPGCGVGVPIWAFKG